MSVLPQRLIALAAIVGAFSWLIGSSPTNEHAALREFYVFVPLTLVLGCAGLARALVDRWRTGAWRQETEGIATLSLLAVAWGHDAGRAAVRRAASMAGHGGAITLEHSNYRLASGAAIVVAALLVLRWATRHDVAAAWRWPNRLSPELAGELPWLLFGLFGILFVANQHHVVTRILVWIYTLL